MVISIVIVMLSTTLACIMEITGISGPVIYYLLGFITGLASLVFGIRGKFLESEKENRDG